MKIAIVCLPQVFDSTFHIICDVLEAARTMHSGVLNISTLSTDGQPVVTASGQRFVPDAALGRARVDLIVVPGIRAQSASDLVEWIEKEPALPVLIPWLQRQYKNGAELATACTGTWVVAEAGLLSGRKATTTWHLADTFRRRYPDVDLQLSKMVTLNDRIRCAGAAMAHLDLVLSIISTACGAEVAQRVGNQLLIDRRPSQANYMIAGFMDDSSEEFRRIDTWIRDRKQTKFSIDDLARGVGLSKRTLARRIETSSGETPVGMVQRIRVQEAIYLVQTTSLPLSEITSHVGYAEPATLRRLIRKRTGRSPSDFRQPRPEFLGA